jgi:undecaprenyl-diphosphatase
MIFSSALQSFDEAVLHLALSTPSPLVKVFFVVTTIGGGWGLIALIPFAMRRSTRAATLWLFAATVLTSGVVSLLKSLAGRVRPCDALGWCAALSAPSPGGGSFPSGHAAGSFAFATFVALRVPRFGPAAYLFAVLVAWSRCVLGVHYPTDIAAGALLGAGISAGVIWLSRVAPLPTRLPAPASTSSPLLPDSSISAPGAPPAPPRR